MVAAAERGVQRRCHVEDCFGVRDSRGPLKMTFEGLENTQKHGLITDY